MNKKGQGSLEYLLMISAAVIIAVTVIILMTSISGEGSGSINQSENTLTTQQSKLLEMKDQAKGYTSGLTVTGLEPNETVALISPQTKRIVKADESGKVKFKYLPKGTYTISRNGSQNIQEVITIEKNNEQITITNFEEYFDNPGSSGSSGSY